MYITFSLGSIIRFLAYLILSVALAITFIPFAKADDNFKSFPKWQYVLNHEHYVKGKSKMEIKYGYLNTYHGIFTSSYIYDDSSLAHWKTLEEFKRDGGGSCVDFAIAEMYDLIRKGVDESIMHIYVVALPDGQKHAVLRVEDFILDVRSKEVYLFKHMQTLYPTMYFHINRHSWERE